MIGWARRRTAERVVSHGRNSAVELDLGSRHETAFVRSKINDGVGDVSGLAEPSERHLPREFLEHCRLITPSNQRVDDRRPNKGWMNRIAADVPAVRSATDFDRSQTAALEAL
jgi:hypothetical protein